MVAHRNRDEAGVMKLLGAALGLAYLATLSAVALISTAWIVDETIRYIAAFAVFFACALATEPLVARVAGKR